MKEIVVIVLSAVALATTSFMAGTYVGYGEPFTKEQLQTPVIQKKDVPQVPKETGETRKKIVVIDSKILESDMSKPFMCQNGSVSTSIFQKSTLTNEEYIKAGDDFWIYHGHNVVNLIGEKINPKTHCVYHVAAFFMRHEINTYFFIRALSWVSQMDNVVGLNLSVAGGDTKNPAAAYSKHEHAFIQKLLDRGTKVVVAIGNEGINLTETNCGIYPACLQKRVSHSENFYVVGPSDYRNHANTSEYLIVETEKGWFQGNPPMIGTSQSAANFTGSLFKQIPSQFSARLRLEK